jgi:hypothetical protein
VVALFFLLSLSFFTSLSAGQTILFLSTHNHHIDIRNSTFYILRFTNMVASNLILAVLALAIPSVFAAPIPAASSGSVSQSAKGTEGAVKPVSVISLQSRQTVYLTVI